MLRRCSQAAERRLGEWHINSMQMSMRGAMYVTMTMMRPGLFLQREEPGSEPGNSLVLSLIHI